MIKILIGTVGICFVVLLALYLQEEPKPSAVLPTIQVKPIVLPDYKNIEYVVDGKKVLLINGVSETPIPDSEAKIFTRYFGNEVRKDLNEDGREDVVFLLTQETGGSGIFFYVVAALNTAQGYIGSQALLLGDRIAPQTTESGDGKLVIVNYADRALGEPFTTSPSIGKSLYILLDTTTMQFGEVVQEFEGEANPDAMTLQMKTWKWIKADLKDGNVIEPKIANKFSITFTNEGNFSAITDCNSMSGGFTSTATDITFGEIMTTLMYCEGSQETEFAKLLTDSTQYHFTNKGELIFDLKFNRGTVTFR